MDTKPDIKPTRTFDPMNRMNTSTDTSQSQNGSTLGCGDAESCSCKQKTTSKNESVQNAMLAYNP